MSQSASNDGVRMATRAAACERCRNRKTRCTNEIPACTPCVKAGASCIYPRPAPVVDDRQSYITSLEARLRVYEAAAAPSERVATPASPAASATRAASIRSPLASGNLVSTSPQTAIMDGNINRGQVSPGSMHSTVENDANSNSIWPVGAANGPPSSEQLLNRLPPNHGLAISAMVASSPIAANSSDMCRDAASERAVLPTEPEMNLMVDRFLRYYNTTFGVFYEPAVRQQVRRVANDHQISRFDVFMVNTMLAIAVCAGEKRVPASRSRSSGQQFWHQALKHVDSALGVDGPRRAQALHLVVHYYLHNPEAGDVWETAGLLIRYVISLGYHNEGNSTQKPERRVDLLERDMRRRIFWATYYVDVTLSTALGRPPGIPQDWIRVELPSLAPDADIHSHAISPHGPSIDKQTLHHVIRLRQMQAEIFSSLYSETAVHRRMDAEWMSATQTKVDEWRDARPPNLPDGSFVNSEWLSLQYLMSTILLNRPCPGNPTPSEVALSRALNASSSVMRLFKQMFRNGKINIYWLAVQHLFMSGITYLSCIVSCDPRSSPTLVDAMLDIQICSGVLEALTAAQPTLAGIRDAFEQVSAAVVGTFSARKGPGSRLNTPPLLPAPRDDLEMVNDIFHVVPGSGYDGIYNETANQDSVPVDFGAFDDPAFEALNSFLMDPSSALMTFSDGIHDARRDGMRDVSAIFDDYPHSFVAGSCDLSRSFQ